MERKGPKMRKTEHRSGEDDELDSTGSRDPNAPDPKTQSSADGTTEKVPPPPDSNNPKRNIGSEGRKRTAPPADDAPPVKMATPLVIVTAPTESDSSSESDLFLRRVERMEIDDPIGGEGGIKGAIPRPQADVLVIQEPSGYFTAQAAYHVQEPVGTNLEAGSGQAVPGGRGHSVLGGDGDCDELAIIPIETNDERYAKIIAKYNDSVTKFKTHLPQFTEIIQAIPDYIGSIRNGMMAIFFQWETDDEMDSIIFSSPLQLEGIHDDLKNFVPWVKEYLNECSRIAENITWAHSLDPAYKPTQLSEGVREILHDIETPLKLASSFLDKCIRRVDAYNKIRLELKAKDLGS